MKFAPQGQKNDQRIVTYATVKDHIITYIQKTYEHGKDIADSLRELKVKDLTAVEPTRQLSTKSVEAEQKIEQHGFDYLYQAEIKSFVERKHVLEQNLNKAYALIFGTYCVKTMQSRVEQYPDFESKIQDDPIELLKAIKILVHDTVRAKYPYASLTETLERMLLVKQQQNEKVGDYVKRFKQERDNLKLMTGSHILDEFVENSTEYRDQTDKAAKQKLKDGAFSKWMAFLMIRGSDQDKYGSLSTMFRTRYSLGEDKYSKTVTDASDVLSQHKWDKVPDKNRNNSNRSPKKDDATASASATTTETSFAQQQEKTCYCCGKKGHIVPQCPDKNKPREEWFMRRAENLMNAEQRRQDEETPDDVSQVTEAPSAASTRTYNTQRRAWSGVQVCLHGRAEAAEQMREEITLDNGSTCNIFCNEELVDNVRQSDHPLRLNTNAGSLTCNEVADLPMPGVGTTEDALVWLERSAITNILSFAKLIDAGYWITFDSKKGDAFLIHTLDGVIKFERTPEGLYNFRPSQAYKDGLAQEAKRKDKDDDPEGQSNLVTTLAENRHGYTQRQFERAKRARKLYHIIGTPTVENFKALLRMNIIQNCPVTVEDVTIAEKIFGPSISSLKGKSTRSKPKPVEADIIQIPKEILVKHREVELCIDTMFINECAMLTSIDRTVRFRALIPIENRDQDEYFRAIDVIFRKYNKAGFLIVRIQCDGEYKAMMSKVQDDLDIVMNYTNASDHVPEAERNNRTIKERFRAEYHRLPYKAIPRIMIRTLAMECTRKLNLFPVKGGVSDHYSPHMIMNQTNLDYSKHCCVPTGAYVQANHESNPTNTNVSRTRDGIYLRANSNIQGGHEVMDLNSGRRITCRKVTEVPVTEVVIKAVEEMAYKQGFKTLKFKNRRGDIFHDTDWIAGVEYDDVENQNDENEEEDEDYNDDEVGNDPEDEDLGDEDEFDPNELDELKAEIEDEANPNEHPEDDDDEEPDEDEPEPDEEPEQEEEPPNETAVVSGESEGDDAEEQHESPEREIRRSTRESVVPERLSYLEVDDKSTRQVTFDDHRTPEIEYCHNLIAQVHPNPDEDVEYETSHAILIARYMDEINGQVTSQGAEYAHSFGQQHLLHKGLKVFGQAGHKAASKEIDQLHRRNCFTPISVNEMTPSERKKAMEALMFLTEKRDKSVKGRMVYNGKPTREWLTREDSASPTAALESIMITAVIDAKERRDVMCADIPNAFIQADMPTVEDGDEKVVMKITGVLVDMLTQLNPELYGPYVVYERGRKVLYVQVLKAIYGMLQAALLWYNKFREDLEGQGFEFNPYDPCVANRMVKQKQHTIRFHVDDLMSSHVDSKVNDDFETWLQAKYGEHNAVVAHRGKVHDFLGMIFEFYDDGTVTLDMSAYVENMLDDFPMKLKKSETARTPAGDGLLNHGQGKKLEKGQSEQFHTSVAKGLYVSKRARPDIQPTIAILCTRVRDPNLADWNKLVRLMKYLNGTRKMKLTLSADNLRVIKWYVDASFAVHPDFKSHTGGTMTFGRGAVQSKSQKQKLNTRSSTEAELVGADDVVTPILWTKQFMEAQGYPVEENILYQDNKSTILLQENGRKSAGKRSRALNVRYFFLTDQVEKGNVSIQYCPTDEMWADFFTKPLQGEKFLYFRAMIMGLDLPKNPPKSSLKS